MGIETSMRRIAASRIARASRRLLDASTLCAIATVGPSGGAYINTAYFAWSRDFELVWLSEPRARHSRNLRANDSAAVAVYDSAQVWGRPDRGIQLFGAAHEVARSVSDGAARLYAARFPEHDETGMGAYCFYAFRPRRIKLFDERELGAGLFVTARLLRDGRLTWERTEIYHSES